MLRIIKFMTLGVTLIIASSLIADEDSDNFRKVSSLFECAILANYSGDKNIEPEDYLDSAIQQGVDMFDEIYQTDKYDLDKVIDLLRVISLENPNFSNEFRLGRLYEMVLRDVIEKIGGAINEDQERVRKEKALDLYTRYNCKFIN